jgi:mannose-6-phosphate isomerase-like protein (cupin superfamily)
VSYPEPVYLGESGEVSAVYRPAGQPAEVEYPNGTRGSYLATGKTTRGLFGLYHWEMAGPPTGPSAHFHRGFTESFYVLSGTVRIYNGREWLDTQPGDFIHVPEGGIHAFRNESGAPASMLIHFAPGAPREAYFEENARIAREGQADPAEVEALYAAHDQIMVAVE